MKNSKFALIHLLVATSVIVFSFTESVSALTSTPKVACINKSSGKIVLRRKCKKKAETEFSKSSYSTPDSALEGDISELTSRLDTLRPAHVYNVGSGADYSTIASAITAAQSEGVSASTPGVIRVAPGVYSNTEVTMIPGITIVGSGIGATILENSGTASTVKMVSNTTLDNLTLKSSGGSNQHSISISESSSVTDVAIRNIQAVHTGTSEVASIFLNDATARLDNVSVDYTSSNTGDFSMIFVGGSSTVTFKSLNLTGSTVEESQGIEVSNTSNVSIYDSSISMTETNNSTRGIFWDSTGTLSIFNTQITSSSTGTNGPETLKIHAGVVTIFNTQLTCLNNQASGYGCIRAFGGSSQTTITNSRIQSANTTSPTVTITTGGTSVKIAHSELINGAVTTIAGGGVQCIANTDELYALLNSVCQ